MLWAQLSQLPYVFPTISQEDLVTEVKEFIKSISSITLQHPNPAKQFQRNYSRCAVVKPWIGKRPEKQRYTAPGFYDGP
jgi:hypothetical protein